MRTQDLITSFLKTVNINFIWRLSTLVSLLVVFGDFGCDVTCKACGVNSPSPIVWVPTLLRSFGERELAWERGWVELVFTDNLQIASKGSEGVYRKLTQPSAQLLND